LTLTGSTLSVGVTGDTGKFINAVEVGVGAAQAVSARMNNATGFQYVTTGSTVTPILLSIGRKATTTTGSTLKIVVKYT